MSIDHQRLLRVVEAARAAWDAQDRLAREISLATQRAAHGENAAKLMQGLWQIMMLEAKPGAHHLEVIIAEETWARARAPENLRRQKRRREAKGAHKQPAHKQPAPRPQELPVPQGIADPQESNLFSPQGSGISPARQQEIDREIENLINLEGLE
jgi:hypothetical protein